MSYTISKELFEAVMGLDKNEVSEIYVSGKDIFWHTYEDEFTRNKDSKINIDSLYFKCKEWAIKQCIYISSWYSNDLSNPLGMCEIGHCVRGKYGIFDGFNEQQAVFDACQWILDKDKQ